MKTSVYLLSAWSLTVGLACLGFAGSAQALDGHKDRSGAFAGIGLGGGAGLEDGEVAGSLMWDAQVGGGATPHLTLALDVDFWLQWYEDHRNFMVTPGPELSYFIGDSGVYVQFGIGMALKTRIFREQNSVVTEDVREFDVGFDMGAAVGWEFFASSNVAVGMNLGVDYVFVRPENLLMVGFAMTLKYY